MKKSAQGTVWLCEDENGRKAVCKSIIARPDIYEKLREKESVYIPKIYEINKPTDSSRDNCVEIIEEYIDGATLREMSLSYKEALSAAVQLCRAVEEIHSLGIVHRDIKPSNIMLDDSGCLKIVDFGSARFFREEMDSDTVCLGTRGFAAPEQYGFSQTDFRADIYAVGQTLRLIFENNNKFPVGYIIDRCTSFDPDKRFSSCKPVIFLLRLAGSFKALAAVLSAAIILTAAVSLGEKPDIADNSLPASAEIADSSVISESEAAVQPTPVSDITESPAEIRDLPDHDYEYEQLRLSLENEYAHSDEGYVTSGISNDFLFQYDIYSDHIVITDFSGDETDVVIPAEFDGLPVTEIAPFAFSSEDITSVQVPDSVIVIGTSAFFGCRYLENITIGANVEFIGESAFMNCESLVTAEMGAKVRYIGETCFAGDSMLDKIVMPDTVEYLGEGAFALCNLHYFNIPTGISVIKPNTFNGKFYSENDGPEMVYLPPNITESTVINELTIPSNVKKIDHDAFSGLRYLEKVTVSEGVEVISAAAFHNCPMQDFVWINEKKIDRDCIFTLYLPESTVISDSTEGMKYNIVRT